MFDQLSSLAREKSASKRRELMGEITDLFVENSENYSNRELVLFGEIFTKLLEHVDRAAKILLSQTVAPVKEIPRELALSLANHDVQIAAPILEHSTVLTNKDLLEIAVRQTMDHRLAICKRTSLVASVTNALIGHKEQPVLQSVCENANAEISAVGFETLADSAEADPALCDILSQRSDLPEHILTRVIPLLPPHAREILKDISEMGDKSTIENLLGAANLQTEDRINDAKQEHIQSKLLLEEILNGDRELDQSIKMLCAEDRALDLGFILAGMTNIPEKQVINALMKKDDKPILMLCRILDISENTFSTVAKLRERRLKLPSGAVVRAIKNFAELEVASAKRIIRSVKARNLASV